MKYSPDRGYREFKITDIRGDWALADWGKGIALNTNDCCGLERWAWQQPNATGWASMQLWVRPDVVGADPDLDIPDAECVTRAIMKAGGPNNSFCFEAS